MKIARTRQVQDTRTKGRQPLPAAKSQSRAMVPVHDTAQTRRRLSSATRNPRTSAFLAQLALQYDGVSIRRQQRAERLNAAISGYGAEAALRNARRYSPSRDLKI